MMLLGCMVAATSTVRRVDAQIVLDGTLGTKGALDGPNYEIGADLGEQHGGNLFHSFETFNVHQGESATFSGPPVVENIIGRVTGGSESMIDGQLRSTIADANLYLINPLGVVFGANAEVDVTGSFAVSTADYLALSDGGRFDAMDPGSSSLSMAPPSAFGFVSRNPSPITVNRSHLTVEPERTLAVASGGIDIQGGKLTAPGGRVELTSVAGPGEVPTAGASVASAAANGSLTMAAGTQIDVSGDGAGSVVIRGGRFELSDTRITAMTTGAKDGGVIDVAVDEFTARDGTLVRTETVGSGRGAAVKVTAARSVSLLDQASPKDTFVGSLTRGSGAGGDVVVHAPAVILDGGNFESRSVQGATGRAGDISLEVDTLTLRNNGALNILSRGEGAGGDVRVVATESIYLGGDDGGGGIGSEARSTGDGGDVVLSSPLIAVNENGLISVSTLGSGNGGNIVLDVDELTIIAGLVVSATEATGHAGTTTVTARDSIFISGRGEGGFVFGFSVGAYGSGDGGGLLIRTPSLVLDEGAQIDARTLATGNAGDLNLEVGELIVQKGSLINTDTLGPGKGGNIRIDAEEAVRVADRDVDNVQSRISSVSAGGDGGSITVLTPLLTVDDGIISTRGLSDGRAGSINLDIGQLQASSGTVIDTSTAREGAGGALIINATDSVTLTGPQTALRSSASGSGQAGEIAVAARNIALEDGASVGATSTGAANAGNIALTARHRFEASGASVTTAANVAEGGNIIISASDLRLEDQSEVTASVAGGEGGGGDVILTGKTVVALNDSDITANADSGPGGNITVQAEAFFNSPDSTLSASSNTGIEGTVQVNAPESNLVTSLVPLPAEFLGADEILAQRCAARAGEASTFVLGGRVGVPPAPDTGWPDAEYP
jgi:filamentous hemagglutinin family protein